MEYQMGKFCKRIVFGYKERICQFYKECLFCFFPVRNDEGYLKIPILNAFLTLSLSLKVCFYHEYFIT